MSEHGPAVASLEAADWTPLAQALYVLMSDYSEERWRAGWNLNNEYVIWDAIAADRNDETASDINIGAINAVSVSGGKWVIWRGGEAVAVDLQGWSAAVRQDRYTAGKLA